MSLEEDQFLIDGRPVHELKVVELRKELEIRSLPKSGNKKELVDRLLNFLRDEQEELIKQQQTNQEQITQENKQSSITATPISMVNQYLVQQQIQLEAARRDADKFRASSSYDSTSSATFQSQMVQQQVEQQIPGHVPDKTENLPQDREHDTNEFVPEEPSGTIQELEPYLEQQTKAVDERDNEDTTPAAEENIVPIVEEKEPIVEEEQILEQQEEEEAGKNTTEFVPDEPEHKKEMIEVDHAKSKEGSPKSVEREESDIEIGKENSEDEEDDRNEVVDDSGKRRRQDLSSFDEKGIKEGTFNINKDFNENINEEGMTEKLFKEDQFAPQTVVTAPPQQISSTLESRRTERKRLPIILASEMVESSKPPEQKEQEEITPEGFVRKRAASPARYFVYKECGKSFRNSPSRLIHIRGLKRPYTQRALLDLLGKFGTVDESTFWIDSIKSNCIVTYDTVEQAEFARERLHNVVWPIASTDALCVEFSTDEKLKRRRAEEQNELTSRARGTGALDLLPETGGRSGLGGLTIVVDNRHPISPSGAQVLIQHEREQQREAEIRKRKAEELEKSQDKLNQLFKKTKVQPSLYFLPLTEAEVAKRQLNKKQPSSNKNNSSSSTRERAREHRKDNDNNHNIHRQRSTQHSSYQRTGGGGGSGGNDRRRTEATFNSSNNKR
ncbi:SAP domain-containing protein [Meloidogyne graminicola]|uniref:SAP domain-containing protein n=1 Tax=Meloidogyne graminicola TaxID=189291 RepID=A0A8S9ZKZ1_9BILA|nr:SAP domain-containing protein [Meloidogyne graminicola]